MNVSSRDRERPHIGWGTVLIFAAACGFLGESLELLHVQGGGIAPPGFALRAALFVAYGAIGAALLLLSRLITRRWPVALAAVGFALAALLPWLNFAFLPRFGSARSLIGNAAGLLQFGGHAGEMLGRYLAVTFGDVARRVHAPAQLDDAALDQWLDRIGRARRAQAAAATLRREAELAVGRGRADERRLLHVARDLYRWKQEMLHGTGDDSRGR